VFVSRFPGIPWGGVRGLCPRCDGLDAAGHRCAPSAPSVGWLTAFPQRSRYAVFVPIDLYTRKPSQACRCRGLACPGVCLSHILVGDDHPWHVGEAFEQLPKALLRSLLVPTTLDENVEDIAILVNRPPEVISCTMNRDEYLIQVPLIARARTAPTEGICIGLTKLPAPLADRFVGHDH